MEIIRNIAELRLAVNSAKVQGKSVGLVPTMGCLHQGHLSLINRAREENDLVVVSVFVNPIQFGPNEDYSRYPRDLERDCRLAANAGADVVFAPSVEEMYPRPTLTHVEVEGLTKWLCGKSRPGHFRGVATVVCKLFNLVQPHKAYFGEKDAQQLSVIKRMVADLNFPVEIVPVSIVREPDGLALSSRNQYLTPDERAKAVVLYQALQKARYLFSQGERSSAKLKEAMSAIITGVPGPVVDYLEIVDPESLEPVENIGAEVLVAVAAWLGTTRLIDNITLRED